MKHYLECPKWDTAKQDMCGQKSPIISEGKKHTFRCPDPEHGLFVIDENGDLIE